MIIWIKNIKCTKDEFFLLYICERKYQYTFKGVKFALYGTYNSGHHEIDVELDGQVIALVYEGKQSLIGPQLLYESHYLEYGEHTVGYLAKKKKKNNEFYKLVYWPSLNAFKEIECFSIHL